MFLKIVPAILIVVALILSPVTPIEAPEPLEPAGTDILEYRQIEAPENKPRVLVMEATAYCYGSVTSRGTTPVPGRTVAVDPQVIPYGSQLVINGVGGYMAEDCGGAIKGNRIDIFVEDYETAIQFGRRQVEVRILETP
jgi:3D (Asp-Asp-Asp) domain-containing protein